MKATVQQLIEALSRIENKQTLVYASANGDEFELDGITANLGWVGSESLTLNLIPVVKD